MSFWKFLISRVFWINLAIAIVVMVVGVFILMQVLKVTTLHGEQLEVPNIKGVKVEKAAEILEQLELRYEVLDSVYMEGKAPLSILEQNPEAGSLVKPDRIIYLTLNAAEVPKVKVPAMVDLSFRQAQALLSGLGLKVGKITYKPDIAKDVVLEQLFKGKSVSAGTSLPKGSEIDLVLGQTDDQQEIPTPDLLGLTLEEAGIVLEDQGLSIGTVAVDAGANKSNAVIYKQIPAVGDGRTLKTGQQVDIFLR